jgi:lipopolysaccharide export system permease protein
MRILQRYLTRHMLVGWLMSGSILAVLIMLLRLIDELDRVTSRYSTGQALLYVAFTLPQQMLTLAPVIVLVGTLAAFARLEQANEMTVVKGSAMDKPRFVAMLGVPFLLLAFTLWGLMEWATPQLHQWGEEIRSEARGDNRLEPGQSLWSRNETFFYRVGELGTEQRPRDIDLFEFADDYRLVRTIHAEQAEILDGRRWRLLDVTERHWIDGILRIETLPSMEVGGLWSGDELNRLLLSVDSMPPTVLYEYRQYLERSGQASDGPALAFWNRVLLPVTTIGMGLLALGLSVKSGSRRTGVGRQLGLGVLVGVLFYLGSQIVLAIGQILVLPPAVTAAIPMTGILVAAAILLWRLRW